jgi:hypothetical protein
MLWVRFLAHKCRIHRAHLSLLSLFTSGSSTVVQNLSPARVPIGRGAQLCKLRGCGVIARSVHSFKPLHGSSAVCHVRPVLRVGSCSFGQVRAGINRAPRCATLMNGLQSAVYRFMPTVSVRTDVLSERAKDDHRSW